MNKAQMTFAAFGLALVLPASACTTTAGGTAPVIPPGEEARPDAPEGRGEGDSRDELEARMHKLVAEQQGRLEAAAGSAKACEDLCSLATSICGVREKLCSIADDHPGDDSAGDRLG